VEYRITAERGFFRVEVVNRQTPAETLRYLTALYAEYEKLRVPRALIHLSRSRALFALGEFQFDDWMQIVRRENAKVALTADSFPVQLSQQYIETVARLRGVEVRALKTDAEAIKWLLAEAPQPVKL
jgi:hypothetical protein